MKVSDALAKILVTPELRPGDESICNIMWHLLNVENFNITHPMLKDWPWWEVGIAYPVPGGQRAYSAASRNGTMWRGEYGRLRRSLLRHLIQWHRERGL